MDFRQRLEQSRIHLASNDTSTEPEEDAVCPYFAADRSKNPVCLDLRLPDGSRKAFPYSYFTEINFDVDAGIEILTTQKRIHIFGRHLSKLYDYLLIYRVRFIQTHIGPDIEEDGLFVKEISIEELH